MHEYMNTLIVAIKKTSGPKNLPTDNEGRYQSLTKRNKGWPL